MVLSWLVKDGACFARQSAIESIIVGTRNPPSSIARNAASDLKDQPPLETGGFYLYNNLRFFKPERKVKMPKFSISGFVVVGFISLCCGMITGYWVKHSNSGSSAFAEEMTPAGDKDVLVTKLNNQVYRVDVKTSNEARALYEKEWVKFCKDHPSAKWSSAPPNPKGNAGVNTFYWNVDER